MTCGCDTEPTQAEIDANADCADCGHSANHHLAPTSPGTVQVTPCRYPTGDDQDGDGDADADDLGPSP